MTSYDFKPFRNCLTTLLPDSISLLQFSDVVRLRAAESKKSVQYVTLAAQVASRTRTILRSCL